MSSRIHERAVRRTRPPFSFTRSWWVAAGVALSLSMTLSGPARADDDLLARATGLMSQRDPAGAYALLAAEEDRRAGDPAFDYLLGVSALDAGHVNRAIFALERALAVRPDDALARAELGRAYLAAGESERGRAELAQARGAVIPPAAAAAIDRVLGALDQAAPSRGPKLSAWIEGGIGHDSNVNSANNAGEFAIPAFGGLLFTVAPGSRQRSDSFATVTAGANLQYALSPTWNLIGAVAGRGVNNRDVHEMNTRTVDATLGVSHASGANVQTVALQSAGAWVSSSVYRTANGLSAQWQSQIDKASQWSAFGQWSRQEYSGQAERNTDRSVLGTGYARNITADGTLVYGSLYVADERARHAEFDYHGHRAAGLRLGAELTLTARSVAFAEGQYERRRYGATEPLFDTTRHDRQTDLLAGVRWTPRPTWSVIPAVRRTQARSDILLYDYARTVVQISLRKEFP